MQLDYVDHKKIDAPTHKTNYFLLEDGGLYLERIQIFDKAGSIFDSFPGVWGLYLIEDVPPHLLSLRTGGQLVNLNGPCAVFVRPYSLVEWVVHQPIQAPWKAICYRTPMPDGFPQEASLFQLNANEHPRSMADISRIFSQKIILTRVEKTEEYNILAVRLKKHLDENYTEDLSLPDFSKKLGINPSTLTRYFKGCYGLAPMEYRNQLRLFTSMVSLILESRAIVDVSNEAGFNNLRNFNKQFLKYTSLQPSKLK